MLVVFFEGGCFWFCLFVVFLVGGVILILFCGYFCFILVFAYIYIHSFLPRNICPYKHLSKAGVSMILVKRLVVSLIECG